MADEKNNVLGAFNIQQYSRSGDRVTISLSINAEYDAGSDGIGAFKTDINFNPAILDYVAGSAQVSGMFGIPNEAEASSGSITMTGIKSPNYTEFSTPVATLSFDIEDTSQTASIYTSDVTFEDIAVDTSTSYFNFGSLTLSGTIKSVSGYALPSTSVTVTYGSSSSKPSVSSDGTFTADIDSGSDTTVTASLDYDASSKAITSLDALDALKLSVGLKPSSGTADAYDFIAADFNQDGKVTSLDALDILKNSVGLSTAQSPKWVFIDGDKDYSSITKNSVTYANGVSLTDVSVDATANVKGILIGDVNASYVPETNNTATEGDDVLIGTSGDDTINGLGGNDTINGGAGDDTLDGGAGNDTVKGGAGDDIIYASFGNDVEDGGEGTDTYIMTVSGNDVVVVDLKLETLYLQGGAPNGLHSILNMEKVTTVGDHAIEIIGSEGPNTLLGAGGADTINGGAGNDTLDAGSGDDKLYGGAGNDTLTGGRGDDTYKYAYDGSDTVSDTSGTDTIYLTTRDSSGNGYWGNGGYFSGNDLVISSTSISLDKLTIKDAKLFSSAIEKITYHAADNKWADNTLQIAFNGEVSDTTHLMYFGTLGDDVIAAGKAYAEIYLNDGDDTARLGDGGGWAQGGNGDDTLTGGIGSDNLYSGSGNDTLDGGAGNDTLEGGAGNDTLTGGRGDDTFKFSYGFGNDTITDFEDGVDTLEYSGSITIGSSADGYRMYTAEDGSTLTLNGVFAPDNSNELQKIVTKALDSAEDNEVEVLVSSLNNSKAIIWNFTDKLIQVPTDYGYSITSLQAKTAYYDGESVDLTKLLNFGEIELQSSTGNDHIFLEGLESTFDYEVETDGGSSMRPFGNDTITGSSNNLVIDFSDHASALVASINDGNVNFTSSFGSIDAKNVAKLEGSNFADTLSGDAGDNRLDGNEGDDTLYGKEGADKLYGSEGNDTLDGGDGDDKLYGGDGNDTLNGSSGDDWLYGGAGTDVIIGGLGYDRIDYRESLAAIVLDFSTGIVSGSDIGTDTISGIERVIGTDFNDTLIGSDNVDYWESFSAGGGNDVVNGKGGNDTIWYGRSNSKITVDLTLGTVISEDGNDQLTSIEWVSATNFSDTLLGSESDDGFHPDIIGDIYAGGSFETGAADVIDGRGGTDTVSYFNTKKTDTFTPNGIQVNLAVGTVIDPAGNTDQLTNIENINGTNFDDQIVGDSEANTLNGYDGNDTLEGGAGDDTLDGGAGNDVINGGAGNDTLYASLGADIEDGGDGIDTYIIRDTLTYIPVIDLKLETAYLQGSTPDFSNSVANIENVTMLGDSTIEIIGSDSNNTLVGGAGDDTLTGGAGNDTLTGGSGADIFKFGSNFGNDTITDFVDGVDTLDYTGSATIGSSADNYKMYSFGDGSTITLSGVAAPNPNHHSFTSGENNFTLVSSAKSYQDAVDYASGMGGTLATFNSSTKFEGFYDAVSNVISSKNLTATTAADGGGAKYVWLGATDQVTEETWIWANNEEMTYSNWGSGSLGSEPDNSNNQDGLALGLENWPSGSSNGAGYGDAGYWNDVDVSNQLFFVVEIA